MAGKPMAVLCESCGEVALMPPKCRECYEVENTGDVDYRERLAKHIQLQQAEQLKQQALAAQCERKQSLAAQREQLKQRRKQEEQQQTLQKMAAMSEVYEQQRAARLAGQLAEKQAKLQFDLEAQRAKDNQFMQALVGCLQSLGFELIDQPSDTKQVARLRAELAKIIRKAV